MALAYKRRSAGSVEKRANQSSSDFQGIFKDDVSIYQAKTGENRIRIVPPTWDEEEDYGFTIPEHYGIDVYVHYGVGPGRAAVLCLNKMKKKKCPVCEHQARLLSSGDEEGAKEIRAGKRVLVYLVDRKDEDHGVQAWAMPFSLDKEIAKHMKDEETGEAIFIDDPNEGYDVIFSKDGEKMLTKYTGVKITRKSSRLGKQFLQEAVDRPLPDLLQWRNYKEINELLKGGEDEDDEDTKATKKRVKNAREYPPDEDAMPAKRRGKPIIDDEIPDYPKKSRRKADDDDEEDDERPTRRSRVEDEDDDEDKPVARRTRRSVDDDDEPAPRRGRPVVDDDDDEDDEPVPRRKARAKVDDDDDEDDVKPKSSRRAKPVEDDDEEDDEPAPRKRKSVVEDDDDEEAPIRKRLAARRQR